MPAPDPTGSDPSFGQRLQQLRRDRGLTQRDLASRVDIDFTYLSKLENSRGEPPSEATIRKLAHELSTDADELLALSGKVPAELRDRAAEDPEFALLLRRLPNLPEADLQRIYKQAHIRRRDLKRPAS